jgi:hypothetical protein
VLIRYLVLASYMLLAIFEQVDGLQFECIQDRHKV